MRDYVLAPPPAALSWRQGACPCAGALDVPPRFAEAARAVCGLFPGAMRWPQVTLAEDAAIAPEGYALDIDEDGARVAFADAAGAFYALVTLGQLAMQADGDIPACHIEDAPALRVRGLMLDISRGRVPTLETLLALADKLALLKMNHLELYIEGFSFAYPSFPQVWANLSPITPEEIRALDAYCAARHIALVPNQNSLGHMGAWLALPEYAALAEAPDGMALFGFKAPPGTLDPADPGSLSLVERLTDDLLPCFASDWFNVGLDEPFELGQGKSRAAMEAGRIGEVYLDYTLKLHDMVSKRGKRMLMWGDIVARHPDIIERLPKDAVVLDWGYEAEHPFDARAAALKAAGLDFVLCPGTSSWSSYVGITENMLANVRAAAAAAHAHGAMGLVITDWGDGGHPQPLPISYPGIALAACLSWREGDIPERALVDALDRFIYQDGAGVMGAFALALGRYPRYEEFLMPCRTLAALAGMTGLLPSAMWNGFVGRFIGGLDVFLDAGILSVYQAHYAARCAFDYPGLLAYLEAQREALSSARMACSDAELVVREYTCAIDMLRYFSHAHALNALADGWDAAQKGAAISALIREAPALLQAHAAVWNARSKPHGLEMSAGAIQKIAAQAAEAIKSAQEEA